MRGAVVSGVAAAMAAASLGEVPKADATCVGILGISINDGSGGHCSASFFSFALGLGPGTSATADGQLNAAIAVGNNVSATAGFEQDDEDAVDAFNLALNFGTATDGAVSTVEAGNGTFNLAANLGGTANEPHPTIGPVDMDISAGDGIGNVALNVIGNRNTIRAETGFLNFAINAGAPFSYPNGSDNLVTATGGLSVAFNSQTFLGEPCALAQCGNTVTAGPLSLVVASGVVRRLVAGGITFANSFNSSTFPDNPNLSSTTVLAAGGTQGNRVRLNSTGNSTNGVAAGGTQGNRVRPSLNAASNRAETTSSGGSVHRSVSGSTKKWAKKFSDPASRSTSGLARNAKADADSTDSDK